jgi:hypothetical protein
MYTQRELDSYGIFEHRHNFSVWAASRAAQRAFTTVGNLKDALEQCGIVTFLKSPNALNTSRKQFDKLHRKWCRSVVQYLKDNDIPNVMFGRAAKLIAVYLKSMVILGGNPFSPLGKVAHPPIDRILLQNMAKIKIIEQEHKRHLKRAKWTELNEDEYYFLIEQLASYIPKDEPMWMLEKHWTVTNI